MISNLAFDPLAYLICYFSSRLYFLTLDYRFWYQDMTENVSKFVALNLNLTCTHLSVHVYLDVLILPRRGILVF